MKMCSTDSSTFPVGESLKPLFPLLFQVEKPLASVCSQTLLLMSQQEVVLWTQWGGVTNVATTKKRWPLNIELMALIDWHKNTQLHHKHTIM